MQKYTQFSTRTSKCIFGYININALNIYQPNIYNLLKLWMKYHNIFQHFFYTLTNILHTNYYLNKDISSKNYTSKIIFFKNLMVLNLIIEINRHGNCNNLKSFVNNDLQGPLKFFFFASRPMVRLAQKPKNCPRIFISPNMTFLFCLWLNDEIIFISITSDILITNWWPCWWSVGFY